MTRSSTLTARQPTGPAVTHALTRLAAELRLVGAGAAGRDRLARALERCAYAAARAGCTAAQICAQVEAVVRAVAAAQRWEAAGHEMVSCQARNLVREAHAAAVAGVIAKDTPAGTAELRSAIRYGGAALSAEFG